MRMMDKAKLSMVDDDADSHDDNYHYASPASIMTTHPVHLKSGL